MANTPNIRFEGFTDDWEQRKLFDEVSSVDTGKSKFISHESGKYEILGSTSVIGYDDSFDYEGDFLLTARVGANAGELYRYSGKVKISDNTVFIQGEQLDFIYYVLLNFDIKKLSFGTGQPLVKASELKMQKISMPISHNERKQIGLFFRNIDHLITLHQRKCDEVKQLKKFMLQKMFPKSGELIPEIRFAEFTDAWERYKFRELYKKSNEKNDGSIGMDKNITVATMQYKEDVKVSTDDYLKTYYTFKLGDIAFEGHQSKEFRFGRFVENDIGDGIVSHIFAVFRPIIDYDLNFWKYAINNEGLMQRVLSHSTKASTMMHDLVTNDFLNEEFLVPKLEEQKKIGKYFSNLDSLITLHQRKCDELKEVKRFMLQNMFPQKG